MYETLGIPLEHHCFVCCDYKYPLLFENMTLYICEKCGRVLDLGQWGDITVNFATGGIVRPLKDLRLIGE